jgi:hypothetical protein
MSPRLWFSIALIAVLFGFWLTMAKPICGDGFAASFARGLGWTCVAKDN